MEAEPEPAPAKERHPLKYKSVRERESEAAAYKPKALRRFIGEYRDPRTETRSLDTYYDQDYPYETQGGSLDMPDITDRIGINLDARSHLALSSVNRSLRQDQFTTNKPYTYSYPVRPLNKERPPGAREKMRALITGQRETRKIGARRKENAASHIQLKAMQRQGTIDYFPVWGVDDDFRVTSYPTGSTIKFKAKLAKQALTGKWGKGKNFKPHAYKDDHRRTQSALNKLYTRHPSLLDKK